MVSRSVGGMVLKGALAGSAERWGQAGAAEVLAAPTPFADSPNRAAEGCGNHRIGLARCGTFQNGHAVDNGRGLCAAQHTTSLALTATSV